MRFLFCGRVFCCRTVPMRRVADFVTRERFALGLLLLAIAAMACLIPAQSDTWWQLRAGEEMWRSGRIMLHDEFTHTVHGRRWPNHEWLAQVVFYKAYALGGMPLLTLVCAAAITSAWIAVVGLTPGPPLLRVALVGSAAVLSSPGWSLRPQALTLALFAATLWILVRQRRLWLLPPLFLVWANLHGAVALGGVLIAAAWVAAAIASRDRLVKLTTVGLACLAATAATPLGISLWFEIPESLERLHAYGVHEWRQPDLATAADLPFWLVAGAVCALAVVRRSALRSLESLTLLASTMLLFALAVRSTRNVPPFLVCAAPALAVLLRGAGELPPILTPESRGRLRIHAAAIATCALIGATVVASAWREPAPRLGWRPLADTVVTALAACPGRLYNRFDEGGYLIWFVRDRKVFMDSRQDPFPAELVLQHIEVERSGDYRMLFDRYGIECSFSRAGSPLARRLKRDGWHELNAAKGWNVYRRPEARSGDSVAARRSTGIGAS